MSYASHAISISGGGAFPSLGQASGLNVTGITTSGATLNWTAGINAVSYIVYVVTPFGVQTTSGVFATSVVLSGLTSATNYSAYVVSVGALNSQAPPSAPVSFTTNSAVLGFDHFASPTGNNTNPGTLAQPWAFNAIVAKAGQYTKLGCMPGVYNVGQYGTVGAGTNSFNIPVMNIPGGTALAPILVASCDASGNYSPAGGGAPGTWAILDGGQTDTAKRTYDYGLTITSTLLIDSTASMTPGVYADGKHYLVFNTYNGNDGYFSSLITANTATSITVSTTLPMMASGTVTAVNTTTGVLTCNQDYFSGSPGSAVRFSSTGTLPAGISAGVTYYVFFPGAQNPTQFQVSTDPTHLSTTIVVPTTTGTGTLSVFTAGCYFISNNPQASPMIGVSGSVASSSNVTIAGFEMQHCTGRTVDMRQPNPVATNGRLTNINCNDNYIHDQSTAFGYGDNTTAITFVAVDGTNGGTTINASGCTNNTFTRVFTTDGSGRSDAIEYWACFGCTSLTNTIVTIAPVATPGTNIAGMTTADMGGSAGECINYKNAGNSGSSIIGNYVDAHLSGAGAGGGAGMDYDNTGPYSPNTDVFAFNLIRAGTGVFFAVAGVALPFSEHENYFNNTFIMEPGGSAPTGIVRYTNANLVNCYNNIYSTSGAWYAYGGSRFNSDAPLLIDYDMFAGPGAYKRTNAPSGGKVLLNTYTAPIGTVNPGSVSGYAASLPVTCIGQDAHTIVASTAGFVGTGVLAAQYQLSATSPFKNMGSQNGQISGSPTDPGCWGNGRTQIGSTYAAALGLT